MRRHILVHCNQAIRKCHKAPDINRLHLVDMVSSSRNILGHLRPLLVSRRADILGSRLPMAQVNNNHTTNNLTAKINTSHSNKDHRMATATPTFVVTST